MECHEINGIPGSKALTKRDSRLMLVLRLNAVKEHVITYRDTCSLSSLKVRGTLACVEFLFCFPLLLGLDSTLKTLQWY